MNRLLRYKNHGRRIFLCTKCEDDQVVRQGLSYTPADMARLTERGMPVNSLLTGKNIIEGEDNPSFDITSDRQRYADVADLWEEHMNLRDKARKAAKAAKAKSKKEPSKTD